ncbi:MAG: aminopeptidase [Rhodobacteraceae bacterium]|nr:aminopeptidase [Paracoccaceae bacterium]
MPIASIAAFELRYQIGNPVFWLCAAFFFMLGFGLSASSAISIGASDSVHENAPFVVSAAIGFFTLFYLILITSFVANTVIRDDVTGFGSIINATPVGRSSFLAGRFLGGLLIAVTGFVSVPLGMAIGVAMPWVDSETVGPSSLATYLWPFAIIALPNLILSSALLFSLATLTRSMLASYIGVLILVLGYLIVSTVLGGQAQYRQHFVRFEPMAITAIVEASRYWTASEMNTRALSLEGDLLINRLATLSWAALLLLVTWARFSFTKPASSRRRPRPLTKQSTGASHAAVAPSRLSPVRMQQHFGHAHALACFIMRLKAECVLMLKSPALIVLLLLALAVTGISLVFSQMTFGTPSYPLTANAVSTVNDSMVIFALIVAVFFGGELVWRERDLRINEIIDAAPVPAWTLFVPKILAVFLILLGMSIVGMLAGMGYQLARGAESISVGLYIVAYLLPQSVDLLLVAVLAVVCQVISPNKYVGWGLMLIWFLGSVVLTELGYTNILYHFGGVPDAPLSDMNGTTDFWVGGLAARTYWLSCGVLLLVLAHWAWPRGAVLAVWPRLKSMPYRATLVSGAIAVAAVVGMVGTGVFIHHNTKVLNAYWTDPQIEAETAEYERRFLKFETMPRPVVTHISFEVAIYPDERRLTATGHYELRNDTDKPIEEVHVRQSDDTVVFQRLDLAGARLMSHDVDHAYRIFRFDTPLAPAASARLDFVSQVWRRGFTNGVPETDIVENGTFVDNSVFAPIIGMDRRGLLQDGTARRRQGLFGQLRSARLEDTSAQQANYVRADWVTSHITISTSADQIPVAPGKKVSESVMDGRRIAVFESKTPILNFFSVQSARYMLAEDRFGDVQLSVYHDPRHGWNVPAMLKAMKASLSYYTKAFGPYQFDYARIVEFPGYQDFAQAFAGTMPYSEGIGFAADVRDPEMIDYVSFIVAHEVAHQYWAHQVVGADLQGATFLSETLAQYSALMVIEELYGPDKARRILRYELDKYLEGRKSDVLDEQPLVRVENQPHIHYAKGAVAMYLLQRRLGEDAVNRALSRVVDRYRFQGAPYPRSLDLVAEFRKEARTPEDQELISDLFERITLYDLKVREAVTRPNPDGGYVTRITVEAGKVHSDGKGFETSVSLDEPIEIGLFASRPGYGSFDADEVLSLTPHPVVTGQQVIEIVTAQEPHFAGIDPYSLYIDREADDNLVMVKPWVEP